MKSLTRVFIPILLMCVFFAMGNSGCDNTSASKIDREQTMAVGDMLASRQPTPRDFGYSLERHLLIKRAYWVNGQRQKALSLPSPIADMPLGYCVLFAANGAVVGRFVVDGKVVSLNAYLTPTSEYYEISNGSGRSQNRWLPDVDGAYGENDKGIFFFTPDGKYVEWTGTYLYSDMPFEVGNPVLKVEAVG